MIWCWWECWWYKQKNPTCLQLVKKLKQPKIFGAILSVWIRYLQTDIIVVESYRKRDNRDVLKYLRVVNKEDKMVNGVHQWCIILCHGNKTCGTLFYLTTGEGHHWRPRHLILPHKQPLDKKCQECRSSTVREGRDVYRTKIRAS